MFRSILFRAFTYVEATRLRFAAGLLALSGTEQPNAIHKVVIAYSFNRNFGFYDNDAAIQCIRKTIQVRREAGNEEKQQ